MLLLTHQSYPINLVHLLLQSYLRRIGRVVAQLEHSVASEARDQPEILGSVAVLEALVGSEVEGEAGKAVVADEPEVRLAVVAVLHKYYYYCL